MNESKGVTLINWLCLPFLPIYVLSLFLSLSKKEKIGKKRNYSTKVTLSDSSLFVFLISPVSMKQNWIWWNQYLFNSLFKYCYKIIILRKIGGFLYKVCIKCFYNLIYMLSIYVLKNKLFKPCFLLNKRLESFVFLSRFEFPTFTYKLIW